MQVREATAKELYDKSGQNIGALRDPNVAYLIVHANDVLGSQLVPGLDVRTRPQEDGICADIVLHEGVHLEKTVHLCFGMLPESGVQNIRMNIDIRRNAAVAIQAHCTFPNAIDIVHIMEASIRIGEGASYSYIERHIHGRHGGVRVKPTARVQVDSGGRFRTEFELVKGRVGELDVDYETLCRRDAVMEMTARVNASGDDVIRLSEKARLVEEGARGVLTSRIAVRGSASADVLNTLAAEAAFTRGHVDCKEIIRGSATARAVPVVEVAHPKAHVTHEAAIGSVDNKQLETLLARGLSEDDAVSLIIDGLLS